MIVQLSAKVSLFLYVRTHSQVAYYLNLADSSRAANDGAIPGARGKDAEGGSANNLPVGALKTRLRG